MKTAEPNLAEARATLGATDSVEYLFPRYNQVLKLLVVEHNLVLGGLANWSQDYRKQGPESLNQFLTEREAQIVETLDDHSRQTREVMAAMPEVLDGLPDLSNTDRQVYQQALSAQTFGRAAAHIREHGSDETVVKGMLTATDILAHDWVINNPGAWIHETPEARHQADDELRQMTSAAAARKAIYDSRNPVLYRYILASNHGIERSVTSLKTFADSVEARSVLRAAFDTHMVAKAKQRENVAAARRTLLHGSDNIANTGRARRTAEHVSLANVIAMAALRPEFDDELFQEEFAAVKEKFMAEHPAPKLDEVPVQPSRRRFWQRHQTEENQALTEEQLWEVWINEPKVQKNPNTRPQPKRVKLLWEAAQTKVQAKYSAAYERQKAREEAETRARQEEADRARRQAEEEARAREQQEQSERARRRAQEEAWQQARERERRRASRPHVPFTQPQPPKAETWEPFPTDLPNERLEELYQIAINNVRMRNRGDANSLERGYRREDVYWVIDRIVKARAETTSKGQPISDKKVYIQFARKSGAANEHAKPWDDEAAKIINNLMGGPSGKIPF